MSGSISRNASASGEFLTLFVGSALKMNENGKMSGSVQGAHPPAVSKCNTASAAVHSSATAPCCCKLPLLSLTLLLLCRYHRKGEAGFAFGPLLCCANQGCCLLLLIALLRAGMTARASPALHPRGCGMTASSGRR